MQHIVLSLVRVSVLYTYFWREHAAEGRVVRHFRRADDDNRVACIKSAPRARRDEAMALAAAHHGEREMHIQKTRGGSQGLQNPGAHVRTSTERSVSVRAQRVHYTEAI